ncbi:histidine kinase dimerization/phospho-acceptor domain-containing protein [Falsiroseomonas sp.]|uniref:PAS domain-containing sensor histidine kinase n=1 Tax=Falsiroseomonas sp. TaxID=2870721 RepID=UPI003F723186
MGADALAEAWPESLEELYEDAPCGYLSWFVEDGAVVRANRTLARWLERDAAEPVQGLRFRDLLTPPGRIIHETRHLPQLRAGGAAEAVALELACAQGRRLPVLVNSTVLRDATGAPRLVRTTLFDATVYRRYEQGLVEARQRAELAEAEARRAQAAAEAADRAKTRFLSAMNHEFRTPIGIVSGFAGLLLQEAAAGRDIGLRMDWLRDIDSAAHHLLALLEDATLFARLDGRRPALQPVAPQRIAGAGLQIAQPALDKAGVTARLAPARGLPPMQADAGLAAEAVACALREMARLAPAGAAITLVCELRAGMGCLSLACPSLHLTPAALENLRAPLDPAAVLSRGLEGAGLGIAVAQRIAELHAGRLDIDQAGLPEERPEAGAADTALVAAGLRIALCLPLAAASAGA